jgi:hypothetical protein
MNTIPEGKMNGVRHYALFAAALMFTRLKADGFSFSPG